MNILHLPDKDFLQQIWLDNPSPIVARLYRMAMATYDELEDLRITVARDAESAREEIGSLKYTIERNEEELNKMQREIERLESMPVDELLLNLAKEFADNRSNARRAKDAMEEMREKLNMWTIMNT